jgi:hypothetical protein
MKPFDAFLEEKLISAGRFLIWGVSLITLIAVFVPFSPRMPGSGLDASYEFGLNQAVAQGLSFGGNIIFAYGPYASVYTGTYHPSTDVMMVGGSLYLALSYWACFLFLIKGVRWYWVFSLLAGLTYEHASLFFSFPLIVGLTCFKIISSKDGGPSGNKAALFYVALLFAPYGLLPLTKGTLPILCCAVSALCAVFFIANKRKLLAATCLLSPLGSMAFFWVFAGQSLENLPTYFIGMSPIISGHSEAMALNGSTLEVVFYLMASTGLLLAIAFQKQLRLTSKIFLFFIYLVFLFVAFKAGFVRQDGHAVTAGSSVLVAAVLLPFVFAVRNQPLPRMIILAMGFSLLPWHYIDSHYNETSFERFVGNVQSTYSSAWYGIKNRMEDGGRLKHAFDAAMNILREQAAFPVLQGTTDIYSFNQSHLIASGNVWSPRPVFQSYLAYTPALAEINKQHLLGSKAPDNIIFKVEPIDGRIPSIEDGPSWPVLILNYQLVGKTYDFVFLRKKHAGDPANNFEMPMLLSRETHTFGEKVLLPRTNCPVFIQIDITPNILGRLASVLFKPGQLQITLELRSGVRKQYRIIASMATSGFLISPLVETTAEFETLYGEHGALNKKLVESFTITS